MKFRRLTTEELKELEPEFIKFLASQGIDAPEWERLKNDEREKAEGMIEIFSDLVISTSLEKIKYLEHRTAHQIKAFWYQKEKVQMIGIDAEGDEEFDFRDMSSKNRSAQVEMSVYQAEKNYEKSREEEMYEMLEKGAGIIDEKRFKDLHTLIRSKDENE